MTRKTIEKTDQAGNILKLSVELTDTAPPLYKLQINDGPTVRWRGRPDDLIEFLDDRPSSAK